MARTLARQLPRALAFASTSNREGSPRALTGCAAQVAAAAGVPRASRANAKAKHRAWGIARMRRRWLCIERQDDTTSFPGCLARRRPTEPAAEQDHARFRRHPREV